VPGSSAFRLAADESGFRNLFLAGDWVKTSINAGCVEAAVLSGVAAARALSSNRSTSARDRSVA
ncbi:MAG: FAD-dependent oxidoreductase, partial [Polyangiaceae bacterium]